MMTRQRTNFVEASSLHFILESEGFLRRKSDTYMNFLSLGVQQTDDTLSYNRLRMGVFLLVLGSFIRATSQKIRIKSTIIN